MNWLVEGADYVVWRRLAETAGHEELAARLDGVHAAVQSGCKTSITLDGRGETSVPLMIIAEASVAAQEGKRQITWRREWVRALVNLAAETDQEEVRESVVAVLTAMDAIIASLKMKRVWPWGLKTRKRRAAEKEGSGSVSPEPQEQAS
ncbi:MAG: hypothetical protein R6X33_00575 [Candidatus Brocadiia bacterium]